MIDSSGPIFVVPLAHRLGTPVPITELDDPRVRENLETLTEQGIITTRVSARHTASLAAAVTPTDVEFDTVILCTDTLEGQTATDWQLRYRAETNLHDIRAFFVGGSACANLGAGWDLASALIRAGAAHAVLVVTADRVLDGERHPMLSMTVFSDGAASCLVTAEPAGPAFALAGSATLSWPAVGRPVKEMAYAKSILTTTRSLAAALTRPAEITHLLTPNFGSATRRLLAMAVPVPTDRLHVGVAPTVGHCFAADTLLNLEDLANHACLTDDDLLLALMSSATTMSATLLRYRTCGVGP